MKKLLKLSLCFVLLFVVTACGNSSVKIKDLYDKEFTDNDGIHIIVQAKDKSLYIQNDKYIKPFTDSKNPPKGPAMGTFNNAKIVEENGKSYLVADKLDYKLQVKDKDTLIDEQNDNREYKSK